jgi:hypothetical protein
MNVLWSQTQAGVDCGQGQIAAKKLLQKIISNDVPVVRAECFVSTLAASIGTGTLLSVSILT